MRRALEFDQRFQLARAFVILALLAFAGHAIYEIGRTGETEDFAYFHQAARALVEGRDLYAAAGGRYIYPPFLAFFFQPLALLPETIAGMVWAVANAAIVGLALHLGAREAQERFLPGASTTVVWRVAALALLFVADKVHAMFTLGQTDGLMLLGFVCGLRWMERRPGLAGIALGLVANIKYLSLISVPYFLWTRRYRAAAASCAAFVFFLALPALQLGVQPLRANLGAAFGGLGRMFGLPVAASAGAQILHVDWARSISLTSAIFRYTRTHALSDAVGVALAAALLVILLAIFLVVARRCGLPLFARAENLPATSARGLAALEWSTLIFFALAFSPQTTSRHMILLVIVYAVALALFHISARRERWLLAGGMLLMLAGLSFPLGSLGWRAALRQWRAVSGASWCAFVFLLALLWAGAAFWNRAKSARQPPLRG